MEANEISLHREKKIYRILIEILIYYVASTYNTLQLITYVNVISASYTMLFPLPFTIISQKIHHLYYVIVISIRIHVSHVELKQEFSRRTLYTYLHDAITRRLS